MSIKVNQVGSPTKNWQVNEDSFVANGDQILVVSSENEGSATITLSLLEAKLFAANNGWVSAGFKKNEPGAESLRVLVRKAGKK